MRTNMIEELKKANGANIYSLYWENGVHTIKILGYVYFSDNYADKKDYRHVEFCWYDMPVSEYLAGGVDMWDEWESEVKQYIGEYTAEEAYEILKSYNASILNVYDITDTTPDGTYIHGISSN